MRGADRFETRLNVAVEGDTGSTRNISDTGVYFETDAQQKVGSRVKLTLEFQLEGKRQKLECQAVVVRIDQLDQRVGIAARLEAPLFGDMTQQIVL